MIAGDALLLPNLLIVLCMLVMLIIAGINTRMLRNLKDYKNPEVRRRISVLIPARNEEENIGACVRSLLGQDYPDFQVIVLNDGSTDNTGKILAELAKADSRLKIISGQPLPPEWIGKHWACHQLYRASDGELLLFTDADTLHAPDTLRCSAAALQTEKADMLSIIPRHKLGSLAEKLIMPIFALGVFGSRPLPARLRPRNINVLSASGKLMLFPRSSYEAIGGFEGIRQLVLDDLHLAEKIIASGMTYRLFDGTDNVSCRMYHNWTELHEGLAKNSFPACGYNVPLSFITWLWINFAFWAPIIELGVHKMPNYPPVLSLGLAAISIIASLLLFTGYYLRFKLPLYMVLFYPVSVSLITAISFSSMYLTLSGQATWKDRKLPKSKIP
ncbi:MAG: glycosyltransferase [Dehalococcoidia bacterium]|nr:glycosyltransferase [Dehalococcoidia bacterium]